MTLRHRLAAAAAGLALAAAPAATLANTAIQFLGVGGNTFTNLQTVDTIGWAFTANANLSVTRFGWLVLAPQLNGFHDIGIWDRSNGALLGSATVLPGAASPDGFRYVSTPFSPFLLAAGKTYVIGGVDTAGDGDSYLTNLPSITTDAAITFVGSANAPANTTGLVFPAGLGVGVKGRFGPNFQFDVIPDVTPTDPVPEPATWAVMIVGFGLAGATLRRRAPQAA